jgi:hypothetical protein
MDQPIICEYTLQLHCLDQCHRWDMMVGRVEHLGLKNETTKKNLREPMDFVP